MDLAIDHLKWIKILKNGIKNQTKKNLIQIVIFMNCVLQTKEFL